MGRFDDLVVKVETYQGLVQENYARVRQIAEELRGGLCDYIGASDGICVRLVPPTGPFEQKEYGDEAFSIPSKGFRTLGPIAFGLAVRVSRGTDWMRLLISCEKIGTNFHVDIQGGKTFSLSMPVSENDPIDFYDYVYSHVSDWFQSQIDHYQRGDYGTREIGFDFSLDSRPVEA